MALAEQPPSRPPVAASARDLSDAEIDELSGLLAGIPELLEPLHFDEADGFAAGIAVQPAAIASDEWLRHVFSAQGLRWGEAEPSPEKRRASELLVRREAVVRCSLAEFGAFDPWFADGEGADDPVAAAVVPWLLGFLSAVERFALRDEPGSDVVQPVLARLGRYLEQPIPDPPPSLDAASLDIMLGVFALYECSERQRYHVATLRRDAGKVGRNDPCPCGSGKKFKHCHGAG